ncbi:aldehyde dehydrogenase family protein [Aestuariivita sp.]|jgi:aldehyde dehydrogenase (NAD+)|uniref:aldehyde dehydrogenase family protein n=1 Tax=Aestuariivita sp. TaxID=1872407 RepID=UPI002173620A|nr:aldehyde dehydrogenase family protein [Aestuariivita sp.]MCE8007374.1 aldehyde dehydrogenase family protein [Aestuariivita sp.]
MTVKEIFDAMDYGPAPESAADALAWLVDQGDRFGHFIDGNFTAPAAGFDSRNPATGEVLATLSQATQEDVDAAVAAARAAQSKWQRLGGPGRARYLYAIARLMQKHARLLAVLETMDNGKPIRESRDIDVPLAQRHFYFHAGMAQLMDAELPDREALGVCGQIIPWNFPLLMLAWKIAPAIAMGNTVVLKPAEYTSLTALLFADICRQAGLPKGVVNIVTGEGAVGEMIVNHPGIDKIAFTGSTEVGRRIRRATAGTGKALTLELGGKSPYIVFDDADLDSAVEGLVDAIWVNQGQVCCAGSRLLVQESVSEAFHAKLKARMDGLRIGDPLDKCIDVGAIVDPVQRDAIARMVEANTSGEIYRAATPLPAQGCFYPPTLITGLGTADPLMQEEIFGPVLVSTTFRTPAEAVALANNTRYGLAATLWTENVNLALDIAPKLAAGVVWVNATNLFDAAAGFGGVRESGFGREGGWEGLAAYTRPRAKAKPLVPIAAFEGDQGLAEGIDRTPKLYIGGKQVRPDGGYSKPVYDRKGQLLGQVPIANRKDIRNAVEAAEAASGWARTTGHLRAQILYYIGENLSARAAEFAGRIDRLTGKRGGKAEVEASIDRLFTYAAWADKYDGRVHGVPIRGVALAMNEPVGVIGAVCADEAPLLGLIGVMAPAIAMGNRTVLVASDPFPLAATDLYQILDTSDVSAGVVNILTGPHADLAPHLAGHMAVDAVWCFSSTDLAETIEREAAGNLKRTWVNKARTRDWTQADAQTFLAAATEVKTIWVPYGE